MMMLMLMLMLKLMRRTGGRTGGRGSTPREQQAVCTSVCVCTFHSFWFFSYDPAWVENHWTCIRVTFHFLRRSINKEPLDMHSCALYS